MQNDEYFRQMLNNIHEGFKDYEFDDMRDLALWLEKQYDAIKNEAVSRLADIGLEALKQIKATL